MSRLSHGPGLRTGRRALGVGAGRSSLATALALLAWLGGCDESPPVGIDDVVDRRDELLLLSDPGSAASLVAGAAARSPGSSSSMSDVVYVSLVPGTVEEGRLAEITNGRNGATSRTAMADGGFDPIPIAAAAGDTIQLRIELSGGGTVYLSSYVPRERPPLVVRTSPPRGKRDVVLNAPIRIVFSEPLDPATVTTASVRLTRSGIPVAGRVVMSGDGLGAEVLPDRPLAASTAYELLLASTAADLNGDALEHFEPISFTTGTTTAVAMAHTNPAALFSVADGLRTFEFEAILHDDGRVTGTFYGFNPSGGWGAGPVSCFRIVDGKTAWVAGVFETGGSVQLGVETGWIATDNGPPASGVPDRLSFAIGIAQNGFGTSQDFCDRTPSGPPPNGLIPRDLETGDIVVTGTTPPPPPPPAPAHLAFTQPPRTGIAGRPMAPSIEVRAVDAGRTRTVAYDGSVTVTLGANSGGAALTGTTTVTAQNGVARFDDLTVSTAGVGYTLVASANGLSADTSEAFDVIEVSGGRIAFHDGAGIHVMNADGSSVTTLVDDPADGAFSHTQPAWSPDGQRVAFRSSRDGNSDIYVMNVDGSGVTRLTTDPALDDSPEWSPDGQRIVFSSERRAGNGGAGEAWPDIYVMSADGTGVVSLTNDAARDVNPTFSPDGTRIAFASDRHAPGGDLEIYVMNADGSGITRLTQSTGTKDLPDWSPDGTRIAYHESKDGSSGGVFVMNADGSGARRVTFGGRAPTWSPDGQTLVFSGASLWLIDPDGSGAVSLGREGYEPDWSPVTPPSGVTRR